MPNPAYYSWLQQDQLVVSILLSTQPSILHIVVGATSSKEVMDWLHSALASPSETRVLCIRAALNHIEHKHKDVSAFLDEAKALSDELDSIGRSLPPGELTIYIYKGSRAQYKQVIQNMMSLAIPLTHDVIHSQLLNHEFLNKHADPSSLLQRNPPQNRNNRGRGRGRGGRGRAPQRSFDNSVVGKEKCQICGLSNPLAPDYWYR